MGLGLDKKQRIMVFVLLAGTFMAVLNATLLTPALPTLMQDMNVEQTTIQWLTSGYALTEAVVIPLAAFLMGRFSTRKLYIGCIALFGVGSLLETFAPNFAFLLAGRIVQAACTGAVMPMVMSVILLIFPRENRGSAMGIVGLLIGFAPAIGPSLSGVLIDTIGWRAIFGIVACIAFAIVIVASVTLKNYGKFDKPKFDILSVIFSTIGLLSLLYGFSTFSSASNHIITVCLVAVGVLFVGLYARRQLKLEEPMLRIGILKITKYRTAVILVMIFQAALIGMETILPLYIQGVLHKTATISGLTLLPGALVGAVLGVFAGRAFDKFGVRKPVVCGATVVLIAAGGLFFFRVDSSVIFIAAVYTTLAVGMQFTMTPLNTWAINSLPNKYVQHAQSTSNTLNQVAASFGTAVLVSISAAVSGMFSSVGGIEQTFIGYHASLTTTAGMVTVAVLIIYIFVRDKKKATHVDVDEQDSINGEDLSLLPSAILVSEVMNRDAITVNESASMGDVIKILAQTQTAGVSVLSGDGKLVGYVTDGDAIRYLAHSESNYMVPSVSTFANFQDDDDVQKRLDELMELNVMELATKRVITVEDTLSLDKACTILAERKIKKAPVTHDGVLVGALSRRNIMNYVMNELRKNV